MVTLPLVPMKVNLRLFPYLLFSQMFLLPGKITTILYAIFGIPLMLLYLTNIGGILARSFRFVYGRFCLCGNRRKAAAAAAASRSRSIRLQRQRSVVTTPSTPARSPSVSRLKSLVTKSPTSKNSSTSAVNQPAGQEGTSTSHQGPVRTNDFTQQLPSEASRYEMILLLL